MKFFVVFPECKSYIFLDVEEEQHMPFIMKCSPYSIKPLKCYPGTGKSPSHGTSYVVHTRSIFDANAMRILCRNILKPKDDATA